MALKACASSTVSGGPGLGQAGAVAARAELAREALQAIDRDDDAAHGAVGDQRDQDQQDGEPDAGDDDRALAQIRALGAALEQLAALGGVQLRDRRADRVELAPALLRGDGGGVGAPDHVLEIARVRGELTPQLGRACALVGVVGHRREGRELPGQLTPRRGVRVQERAVLGEQEAPRAGLQVLREPLDRVDRVARLA